MPRGGDRDYSDSVSSDGRPVKTSVSEPSARDAATPTTVVAEEVDAFRTAVSGMEIDYVRTSVGSGPCVATSIGDDDIALSAGSMGFSAVAHGETPSDRTMLSLITSAPPGSTWNGVEVAPGDLIGYAPGTTFIANELAGLGAVVVGVSTAAAQRVADELGRRDPTTARSVKPLPFGPSVRRLREAMLHLASRPELLARPEERQRLLEEAVRVITDVNEAGSRRRHPSLDSRRIVRSSIEYSISTASLSPTITELCRAAAVSESKLRQSFIDVVGMPPTRFFQNQLLNEARRRLLAAQPGVSTVTAVAASLGVTQFGRFAGRYRELFDELPSNTLMSAAE